ncbi:hypothetical protein [Lentzea sp. CC55]|uniref:hypothetical protein n=1 Tax=Lentzea sp. CC55 TaxID=2884909 RepID=UPI001F16BF2B|nr:hypothetical protein [Lentzea sp. CC55]MCG8925071.1 hypothetical protein [Lentzea sp. CC55]
MGSFAVGQRHVLVVEDGEQAPADDTCQVGYGGPLPRLDRGPPPSARRTAVSTQDRAVHGTSPTPAGERLTVAGTNRSVRYPATHP